MTSAVLTASTYFLLGIMIVFMTILFSTIITNLLVKVPFVPTRKRIINHIIKLAKIKNGDKVYDLGCGDGRFLFEAQKLSKTTATGFEKAILPYLLANISKFILNLNTKIKRKNFLTANLSDADIIYCYLGPEVMNQIGTKFKNECKKGAKLYSHTFSIKNLVPKKVWERNKKEKLPTIYLYQI